MKLLKSHSLVELPKERRLTEGSCMVEKVESKGIIAQIVPDEGGRRAFDLRWENVPSQLDTDPCLPYWPRPTSHDIHLSPSHSIYKLSLDLGNQSARNCFIELCERLEIKLRKGTTNEEFVYHQLATLPSRQGNIEESTHPIRFLSTADECVSTSVKLRYCFGATESGLSQDLIFGDTPRVLLIVAPLHSHIVSQQIAQVLKGHGINGNQLSIAFAQQRSMAGGLDEHLVTPEWATICFDEF